MQIFIFFGRIFKSGTEPVLFQSGLVGDQTSAVVSKDQLGNPESLI